jgi:hypothetical protein
MSDETTPQDDKAMPPASAGSQPVAWANEDDDDIYEVGLSEARAHYVLERAANGMYSHRNPRIVPLYRSPTLTDEERTAIGLARSVFEDYKMSRLHSAADEVLERLLERTK